MFMNIVEKLGCQWGRRARPIRCSKSIAI